MNDCKEIIHRFENQNPNPNCKIKIMNQKINEEEKNKKKKKKKISEFEFCKVCHRNHDQGNRHKYFPNHKKSLSTFLSRFQKKLANIHFSLKNPSILRPEQASLSRIWCVFCDTDIDEIGSSFACANVINHLGSADHLKNLKHFLWKYGDGMDRLDTFRVSEADLAKWEKKCKSLKNEAAPSSDQSHGLQVGASNDIPNELGHEIINNFENNAFNPLNSNLSNGVMPLQYYTNEYQISHSGLSAGTSGCPFIHDAICSLPAEVCPGTTLWNSNNLTGDWNGQHSLPDNSRICSHNLNNGGVYQDERMVKGMNNSQGSQNLTQISVMAHKTSEGNIHSGGLPPWFEAIEEHHLNVQLKPVSSSLNKPGKSHKLNPKRVGAAWAEKRKMEMEMEKRGEIVKSDYDANWLPNFGRVWQSGSRKESRKEFEKEKQKLPNVESHSEMSITIQPYVSKRMRRDASE